MTEKVDLPAELEELLDDFGTTSYYLGQLSCGQGVSEKEHNEAEDQDFEAEKLLRVAIKRAITVGPCALCEVKP